MESIRAQSVAPIEVIVVDDGSTDRTVEIVHQFDEVNLICQENAGSAAARNTGMKHCSGDFVAFFDYDDLWDSEKIRYQAEYLEAHSEVGFVLGTQRIFVEPDSDPPAWLTESMMNERTVCAGTATLMLRRSIFTTVGPFDPTYAVSQDTDWFVRAVELGIGMAIVEEATILRRFHGSNATYNIEDLNRNLLRIVHASVRRKREN